MSVTYYVRAIDGYAPPVPTKMKYSMYDLDLDSYRAANGDLIRNVVATKLKFALTFPSMYKASMKALLQMINTPSRRLTILYEDIVTGALKEGVFYRGDIEVEIRDVLAPDNEEVLFEPFEVGLIEY